MRNSHREIVRALLKSKEGLTQNEIKAQTRFSLMEISRGLKELSKGGLVSYDIGSRDENGALKYRATPLSPRAFFREWLSDFVKTSEEIRIADYSGTLFIKSDVGGAEVFRELQGDKQVSEVIEGLRNRISELWKLRILTSYSEKKKQIVETYRKALLELIEAQRKISDKSTDELLKGDPQKAEQIKQLHGEIISFDDVDWVGGVYGILSILDHAENLDLEEKKVKQLRKILLNHNTFSLYIKTIDIPDSVFSITLKAPEEIGMAFLSIREEINPTFDPKLTFDQNIEKILGHKIQYEPMYELKQQQKD